MALSPNDGRLVRRGTSMVRRRLRGKKRRSVTPIPTYKLWVTVAGRTRSRPKATPPNPLGGGQDDTAQLISWLSGVPDGAEIRWTQQYILNSEWLLTSRKGLRFIANPATPTFVRNALPGTAISLLKFTTCEEIDLEGVSIQGDNSSIGQGVSQGNKEFMHGVFLWSTKGFSYQGGTISNCWGDNISIAVTGFTAGSEDVLVEDATLDGAGRSCFVTNSGKRITCRNVVHKHWWYVASHHEIEVPAGLTDLWVQDCSFLDAAVADPDGPLATMALVGSSWYLWTWCIW